jgi:ATP-dependent DNA helicase DinG
VSDLASVFSETGALAQVVPGFRARPFQLEMAEAIENVIKNQSVIVAEAGTGTGKTFAYLVPALLSGGKVIISTGTKTLQDQLFGRDIPTVRDALKVPVTVALLKGRANYVCHHHLEHAKDDGRLPTRDDVVYLARIESFARISNTGDRADLAEVPENAGVWPLVTSTRDNCLRSQCEHYDKCFVMKARKQALESDVVVVNHHLFFADVMLRDEGVAEILPACNTVIFDEAHQLPETASLFFGQSVSTTQLVDLARDARIEAATSAKDAAELPVMASALEKAALDLQHVSNTTTGTGL